MLIVAPLPVRMRWDESTEASHARIRSALDRLGASRVTMEDLVDAAEAAAAVASCGRTLSMVLKVRFGCACITMQLAGDNRCWYVCCICADDTVAA